MASSDPHVFPKVERSRNITIVKFTSDAIRDVESVISRELEEITIGTGEQLLLLDFTNVEQLNGIELGTLITLHKQVKQTGGRLILFNLSAQLFELFKITNLDTLLRIRRARLVELSGLPPQMGLSPNPALMERRGLYRTKAARVWPRVSTSP